ncbi:ribosome biogenesis GTPase Der [Candidatus Hepatoplasma crinochetorum]|uniref:GTPase Der n=1 Tax=Candidatus Hepatoplasma crinochetorum Av TaxID=1427984 RepID=W8GMF2_9MOLU|nr:ribosome biogenesis GTPase Der [Candidatus Hepatoplasma crinochetorum]AHK22206.1 GTP-binding protein EngA [Candidatus Hepatoplasma crinochetorum Av]BDV02793.1 MAG: GTPase Der [Candidatus Hepatoplasma crinochetorum]
MFKIPKVVIIGRPNVGKSTLFNRLIGKKISITFDKEGVTRDRIYQKSTWIDKEFLIIDTGGYSKNNNISFQNDINIQIQIALKEADLILMVVSKKEGLLKEDRLIAKEILKLKKKVILAINKSDNLLEINNDIKDFYSLGIKKIFPISSLHGTNINNLLDEITKNLNFSNIKEESNYLKIGIIGKPNVGKSTLLNKILKNERIIVSNKPGTTRDFIDTFIEIKDKKYQITDTAGIKKNKKALDQIEWLSELRSNFVIMNSQIILLVIDYKQEISLIDQKLLSILKDEYKPTILLINKTDQFINSDYENVKLEIKNKFKFASWVKVEFISAKTGKNLDNLFEIVNQVWENKNKNIKKSHLNQFLNDIQMLKTPPRHNGILIKFDYITYFNKNYPNFIIFTNYPQYIHFSYKRFIENQIRKIFNFEGIPFKITFKRNVK